MDAGTWSVGELLIIFGARCVNVARCNVSEHLHDGIAQR